MRVSTNWLKDFVTLPPPIERIAERLTLAGLEVKKIEMTLDQKDTIFEMEITSNRPDWLSHMGVAREIAAVENLSLKIPSIEKTATRPSPSGWKLQLKEFEGCPYYTGVYMEGITQAPTPDFMKDRLAACGIRSISLIVDITNYVLLETGQPLHAFDADLIQGQEIQIRRAKAKEKFTAINGTELTLEPGDLLIADNQRGIALAGIMGGRDSEVNERTRNIFLESAFFHPWWVRQSSRKLGISSESAYRFERRVDPEGVDFARERAIALMSQYAKPRFISGVLRAGEKPSTAKNRIHFSLAEIEKKLGFQIKSSQVASILTRLGLEPKQDSAEIWKVDVPSFRPDITQPVDLVEEVARIYGYDNIPETLPSRPPLGATKNALFEEEEETRNLMAGMGFHETITFSLISATGLDPQKDLEQAVYIHNPQNQDLCWMRPVLLPSLLQVIQKNNYQGASGVAVFELANVYSLSKEKHSQEEASLGIALSGKWKTKTWLDPERSANFYDLKGVLEVLFEHFGVQDIQFAGTEKSFLKKANSQAIMAKGEVIGFWGEAAHPIAKLWDLETPVYFAQISLPKMLKHTLKIKTFQEMPRFPSLERDLGLQVPDATQAGEIESEIKKLSNGLVVKVTLFDFFQGGRIPKGYKNLGFRLTYQSPQKTLVSSEIQKLHSEIAENIVKKFQASFQSV